MNQDAVVTFLQAVRRRLWLEKVLVRLHTAIWVGSGTVLAMAAISGLISSTPISTAISVALAAAVLVTLPAAIRPPTLVDSAIRADRIFVGRSLLTTALGTRIPGYTETPASRLLLARATDAVASWRKNLPSVWRAPSPAGFILATIPTFVAILLLAVYTTSDLPHAYTPPQDDARIVGQQSADTGIEQLRDSIARAAARDTAKDPVVNKSGQRDQQATLNNVPTAGAVETPVDILADQAAGYAGTDADDGREAGDARRAPEHALLENLHESPQLAGKSLEEIARHGDTVAGTTAGTDDYANILVADGHTGFAIQPAAAPTSASTWSTMTPAEVIYARRYLASGEFRND